MLGVFLFCLYILIGIFAYFCINIKIRLDEKKGNDWCEPDIAIVGIVGPVFWPILIVVLVIIKIVQQFDYWCEQIAEFIFRTIGEK